MRTIIAWLLLLAGCSETTLPTDAGVDDETSEPSCEPTPARCEGLGDERPERLSEHAAAYDQDRLELIVFGGTPTIPEACAIGGPITFVDETWIYDDVCNAWTRVEGDTPSPSGRHMATWGDGQVWVFGGRFRDADAPGGAYALYDDLFRFDVAARTWHSVEVTGTRPAARVNGALVWDRLRRKLWLFGGNSSSDGAFYEARSDLWSFDPEAGAWREEVMNDAPPSPRLFHAAFIDRSRDALVVYGGADETAFGDTARYHADLWSFDLETRRWRGVAPSRAPRGRFWAGLDHDPERDVYVLYGGHDDGMLGNRNDTWRFDPEARDWSRVSEGDRLSTPARGFCDFPPDFTDVDADSPERRSAHTFAWSNACDHGIVFGGKTDCGAIDDVWTLEGDAWHERLAATEGEACLRWRTEPDTCADMCF